jgi:hypothetical protein
MAWSLAGPATLTKELRQRHQVVHWSGTCSACSDYAGFGYSWAMVITPGLPAGAAQAVAHESFHIADQVQVPPVDARPAALCLGRCPDGSRPWEGHTIRRKHGGQKLQAKRRHPEPNQPPGGVLGQPGP